jgi:predicted phage terminase large subunit-like protein
MNSAWNSANAVLAEQRLRRDLRGSLEAWCRFALKGVGQAPARHHVEIIHALERVTSGETRRLLLLLPPGSAKSTYASRLFPVWWLVRHPASAVIAACHTARLAEDFGRGVRGLVVEHAARLGVDLRADARAAGRFVTEQGGEYFAIGARGAVTGRRADLVLVDDPIRSFADAESYSAREHLWEWFRSELVTRLKPRGRIVLVMTRWHCDDLAGRLIAQGGWDVLRLPALAEAGDALGREAGAALWPEWEDRPALLEKKALLGERHFAALFQQSPIQAGGQIFDPRQLRVVDSVPEGVAVRGWDLAGTGDAKGDPDWTVGVKLVRSAAGFLFIDDVVRFRAVPSEVAERVRAVTVADGKAVTVGLPQDPGQAGKSQIMFYIQMLAGFRVVATLESGKKEIRADGVSSQVSGGTMSMRRAHWNAAFMDELANFPVGHKDDQVDALARAFNLMLTHGAPASFVHLPFSER